MSGDSNGGSNFPHRLLLNDTQVSRLRKAFANGSSTNIKFLKTQLSKMVSHGKGGFLSMLLGTLAGSLLGSILTGKRVTGAGEGAPATSQG